jgi:hypothetical protein
MEIAIVPGFMIRRMFDDGQKQIHANILFSWILIILAFLILNALNIRSIAIPHFCLFRESLGVPCPGCGITSSMFAIARGDIFLSWRSNPSGLALLVFGLMQVPLRILAIKFNRMSESVFRISRLGNVLVILSLIAAWIAKLG